MGIWTSPELLLYVGVPETSGTAGPQLGCETVLTEIVLVPESVTSNLVHPHSNTVAGELFEVGPGLSCMVVSAESESSDLQAAKNAPAGAASSEHARKSICFSRVGLILQLNRISVRSPVLVKRGCRSSLGLQRHVLFISL
jgi:hypothetical protein